MRAERQRLSEAIAGELPLQKKKAEAEEARYKAELNRATNRLRALEGNESNYQSTWCGFSKKLKPAARSEAFTLRERQKALELPIQCGTRYVLAGELWGYNYNEVSKKVTARLAKLEAELSRYEPIFAKREEKYEGSRSQIHNLKAMAAAHKDATRSLAAKARQKLPLNQTCPYCGGTVGPHGHIDHIYPVSRGGRSIIGNLVWTCSPCNRKKAHLTLGHFCEKFSLNILEIQQRLALLKKDY
jgi:5-methylcytosine-specific restriction endonuclease McrA